MHETKNNGYVPAESAASVISTRDQKNLYNPGPAGRQVASSGRSGLVMQLTPPQVLTFITKAKNNVD
jgi:hypothetical protein